MDPTLTFTGAKDNSEMAYYKIPVIRPGLICVQNAFLVGLVEKKIKSTKINCGHFLIGFVN